MSIMVSVVIPFFNRTGWLKDAIESVRSQTLKDLEIILADDGSQESLGFLSEFYDLPIRYFRQNHAGASVARNRGIREAIGKYIAFLDSDDLFFPTKLEVQVAAMEANPGVLLSHTSYYRVDAQGHRLGKVNSGIFTGMVYPRILLGCPIATPTVMIRAESAVENLFPPNAHYGEDVIGWIRIARRSSILGIDSPLSSVRIHDGNAIQNPAAQEEGVLNILRWALDEDPLLGPIFQRKLYANGYLRCARIFLGFGRKKDAVRCLAISVRKWPFSLHLITPILSLLIPRKLLLWWRGKRPSVL